MTAVGGNGALPILRARTVSTPYAGGLPSAAEPTEYARSKPQSVLRPSVFAATPLFGKQPTKGVTYTLASADHLHHLDDASSDGRIWGLVQRAIRDAGFRSVPAHVAILDKGQRSVKGLNSGSEGVVTVDLVMALQKSAQADNSHPPDTRAHADAGELIASTLGSLPLTLSRNPSHVYAALHRNAIRRYEMVDHLHLSDVLIALRNAGYIVDPKSRLLTRATPIHSAAE
jgi:hypothetical protein